MRLLARSAIILVAIIYPVLVSSMPSLEEPLEIEGITGPVRGPVLVRSAAFTDLEPLTADGGPVATPTPAPTPRATAAATARPTTKPSATAPPATPAPTSAPRPATPAATRPPSSGQPSAATTPAPTPAPRPYDREDVKRRIRASWPGDGDEAVAVVGCETGGTYNPQATSSNGLYKGLWQFHQDTWERNGGKGDPRDHSPEEQTRVAWNLYQKQGWDPWPSCRPD